MGGGERWEGVCGEIDTFPIERSVRGVCGEECG